MARKAIVDRETVLQLLREGKTSQAIADRYGVSRQAIDLYRKQFTKSGLLTGTRSASPLITDKPIPEPGIQYSTQPIPEPIPATQPPATYTTTPNPAPQVSLDQMVDLIIQAFSALKRVNELEAEIVKIRNSYNTLLQQVEQLQAREQKRKEQEMRWIHAQSPGIMTNNPD